MSPMSKFKFYAVTVFALALSTLPAIFTTLAYFPLWRERGTGAFLSGFTLVLLLVAIAPIFKLVRRMLASPSILFVWLFLFLTFFLLKSIADEMTVIAFVGLISNTAAALLFKFAERYR